jgi:C1A family cysteine protease
MRAVLFLALVAVVCARVHIRHSEYQNEFVKFVNEYNKVYDSVETTFSRFAIFKDNLNKINDINAANLTWWAGVNEYSDMTEEEFLATHTGHVSEEGENREILAPLVNEANDIDWRDKGAVTPVKNQGSCGSCWAFSTTGTTEGFVAIKTGKLPNLAEQQLVDCCKQGGCQGCRGGLPSAALKWVASNGLCSQSDYPYTARDGQCKKTCQAVAKISSSTGGRGESALQSALDKVPVSIAVDASGGFQSYKGGVFNGPCGTSLNHAITAVGYTSQYWIVKNSWGTGWGSGGYIFMARGKNLCGLGNVLAWVG